MKLYWNVFIYIYCIDDKVVSKSRKAQKIIRSKVVSERKEGRERRTERGKEVKKIEKRKKRQKR